MPVIADPAITENDLTQSCGWTLANFIYFYDRVAELSDLAEKANSSDVSKEETVRLWQSAFGDVYPSSLTEEEERAAKEFSYQPEPAGRKALPCQAKISAALIRDYGGPIIQSYSDDGRRLPKGQKIRFTLDETNVPWPYEIRWVVINHGREARLRHDLGHSDSSGNRQHEEVTMYKGHHYMDCEIWKDGKLAARARHIVNIA